MEEENTRTASRSATHDSNGKNIKILYWLFIFVIFLAISSLIIGSIGLYFSLENKNRITLFLKGTTESKLTSTTTKKNLYTYYVPEDEKLKKGKYEITLNNSSNIDFNITDQNNIDLTGKIIRGNENLPTTINFNSKNEIRELKLNYNTTSTDKTLYNISLNKN